MIVTVTPNPAVDLTLEAGHLVRGGTTVVAPAAARAGGKGLNVSRVLAQVGVPTTAVAPVGAASLAWFDAGLTGIPHTLVVCEAPTRRTYALHECDDDITSIVNEHGGPRSTHEWAQVLDAVDLVLATRVRGDHGCLAVCGSLPPGTPDLLIARLVALAARHGVPAVVDTSGSHLLAAARAGAALLKPNRDELTAVLGDVEPVAGARMLQVYGAQTVVVSLGADGLAVVPPRGPAVRARLAAPLRGNPTGAGDAAVAAACSLLVDPAVRTALLAGDTRAATAVAVRAAAWSAAAVLTDRAGEIHPDHDRLARELDVDVITETE